MIELPTTIVSTSSVIAPDASQSFLRNGCADSSPTGSAMAPMDMHHISSDGCSRDEAEELSDKRLKRKKKHRICIRCSVRFRCNFQLRGKTAPTPARARRIGILKYKPPRHHFILKINLRAVQIQIRLHVAQNPHAMRFHLL